MATNLRSIVSALLPWWMTAGQGGQLAEALAGVADVHVQKVRSGLEARFPRRAGESALALIGRYRLIPRGRAEVAAHYAERLIAWRGRLGHRTRGSAFALLSQIGHYWGEARAWVWDVRGNRRERAADGTESYSHGGTWVWDSVVGWSRFWVVLDGTTCDLTVQDDFVPGGTVGLGGSVPADWDAMRALVTGQHRWCPAGTQPEWLVVSLDGEDPLPDDAWATWGKPYGIGGGEIRLIPARDTSFRYVSLLARTYSGDPDRACEEAQRGASGTPFRGDPTSFPLTAAGPEGKVYSGDATSFPVAVALPDDGSAPWL